jgi:hypothetical protein
VSKTSDRPLASAAMAYFLTRKEARGAACALNDHFRNLRASYFRREDGTWVVRMAGMPLNEFVDVLDAAGFDNRL